MKVHKGDTVLVISGKDKGPRAKSCRRIRTATGYWSRVSTGSRSTPRSRPPSGARSGGIVTQEAPIHVSNVMVVDSDGKPTRIGYRVDEETGKRVRISKRNGKDI